MRRFAWVVLPLAGCHWVFGVGADKVAADAEPARVSFRVEVSEINSRLQVSPGSLKLADSYLRVYSVPNAPTVAPSRVPLEETAPQEYSAEVAEGASFDVVWRTIDDVVRVQHAPERSQWSKHIVFGRLDETPPGPGDMLRIKTRLMAPWDSESSAQLHVAGAWSYSPIPGPVAGATELDRAGQWSDQLSLSNRLLARPVADRGDLVSVLRYRRGESADTLEEFLLLPTLEYRVGGETKVDGMLSAADRRHQVDAMLDDDRAADRFAATRPVMQAPTTTWAVHSLLTFPPSLQGIRLASAPQALTLPYRVTLTYGDPFEGRRLLLFHQYTSRTTTLTNVGTVSLIGGMYAWVDADSARQLTTDAALPLVVSVGGVELGEPSATVSVNPAAELPISFSADGDAGTYQATVFEVLPDAASEATTTVSRAVLTSTVGPTFLLPAGTLTVGRTYFIRAVTFRGFGPMEPGGPVVQLPFRVGYFDSGVFTIP